MAEIVSGASADKWTIDPISKAGRVTLYGPDGAALAYPSLTGRARAAVLIRQTTTTAVGTPVWALRNPTAGRTIYIVRAEFSLSFDTTGAATVMRYELIKGTGVTAFGGSPVTVTPLIKKTSIGQVGAEVRVLDTGLTLTGVVYGGAFYHMTWPRLTISASQAGAVSPQHILEFNPPIELAQNEVFVIRNGPTSTASPNSVNGDTLMGSVEFQEST